MFLLPVPMQLTRTAHAGLASAGRLVGVAADLPQRLGRLVGEAEELIGGARSSLRSVDATIAAADAAIRRVDGVLDRVEGTIARTDGVLDGTDAILTRTRGVVGTAEDLTGQIQPSVQRVLPLAEKFTDSVSPDEVNAAIALVNELPQLTRSLREDVLPVLGTLNGVGPDVNELLHVMDDVRRAILGIPGFTFLKKRGAERIEEDDAHEVHPRDPDVDVRVHDRPGD
jgi:ABC-type transporter Mla subunit MlaD